jgi:hypothetical protein
MIVRDVRVFTKSRKTLLFFFLFLLLRSSHSSLLFSCLSCLTPGNRHSDHREESVDLLELFVLLQRSNCFLLDELESLLIIEIPVEIDVGEERRDVPSVVLLLKVDLDPKLHHPEVEEAEILTADLAAPRVVFASGHLCRQIVGLL